MRKAAQVHVLLSCLWLCSAQLSDDMDSCRHQLPDLSCLSSQQAGGWSFRQRCRQDYTFWSGEVCLNCPMAQSGGNWDVCFRMSTQRELVDLTFPLPDPFIALLPFSHVSHTWIQTPLLTPTFQHSHTSLLFFLSMFKTHSECISPSSPWWKQFTVTCLWPLPFPQDFCEASDSSWQWLGGGQVVQECLVPWSHSIHLSTSWLETPPGNLSVHAQSCLAPEYEQCFQPGSQTCS